MEEYQVLFPTSSTLSAVSSLSDFNVAHSHTCNVHGEKADDLRTQRKMTSGKKEGDKEIKKHRYAFQARSQINILDDGYRWRKYGKKIVKSNKFPRGYYRCTCGGCNVKKQVQRHPKDEQIVVTTYEGMHIHPVEKSPENNPLCNIYIF